MATNLPPASVAADMDRIFKPLTDRVAATALSEAQQRDAARRRGKRDWRGFILVAPALVLLAGGALAVGYTQYGEAPRLSASTTRAAASQSPSRTAVSGPKRPMVPVPAGDTVVALPQPETDRLESPRAGASVPTARPIPAKLRAAPRERPLRVAAADMPARADRRDTAADASCPPGSLEDRCIYQDVLDADARLRRAYRRARQTGVPYGQLSAINRQWNRAVESAQDDPDGTIRRYDRLTDMLDRARQESAE